MKLHLAAIALATLVSQAASAATIVNGSFEDTSPTDVFDTLGAGNGALTGWSIDSGSVDFIGSYWQAAAGANSLDMAGNALGSISQLITDLTIGVRYMVTFAMSGNPDGGTGPKSMLVNAGNLPDGTYEYTVTGANALDKMKWEYKQFFFTASDTSELLTFSALPTNTTGSFFGPGLDDISIAAVPLPASAPLILAGLGALAALRRRRNRA